MTIVGSDGHLDHPSKIGDAVGNALGGAKKRQDDQGLRRAAAVGKMKMPLTSQGWSSDDWLRDTFGVAWLHREEVGPCATLFGCSKDPR